MEFDEFSNQVIGCAAEYMLNFNVQKLNTGLKRQVVEVPSCSSWCNTIEAHNELKRIIAPLASLNIQIIASTLPPLPTL